MTPAEEIHNKILNLKAKLDENNPGMENWLRDIHNSLHKDEALVQVLTPAEIGIIVQGLSIKAKTVIVEDAVKSKVSNKKLGNLNLEEI